MTPLMLAINKGHLDLVQTLVHGKVDLNKAHPVSRLYTFNSISAIVLLTRVIIIIQQEMGWTAIFFAAKSGNLEIFRELLKGGADTEIEVSCYTIPLIHILTRAHVCSNSHTYTRTQVHVCSNTHTLSQNTHRQ